MQIVMSIIGYHLTAPHHPWMRWSTPGPELSDFPSDGMPARMPARILEFQKECQNICQKECQTIIFNINFQMACQNITATFAISSQGGHERK